MPERRQALYFFHLIVPEVELDQRSKFAEILNLIDVVVAKVEIP